MARSRKRTPIADRGSDVSDKLCKTRSHGRTRTAARGALARGGDDLPSHRLTENPMTFRKERR